MLEFIGMGKDFRNRTMVAQLLRPTTKNWDLTMLKIFYTAKNIQTNQKVREWEKRFLPIYIR